MKTNFLGTLIFLILSIFSLTKTSYAFGPSCQAAEEISPGLQNGIVLDPGTTHYYKIKLSYGQTLRCNLHHLREINTGLLGIQLFYEGGYYVMPGCGGGTPYNECTMILTTDPCEFHTADKELIFTSYGEGYYVIAVFGIRDAGNAYDLNIQVN